ncbi:MAG: hypothetical protein A2096_16820 [Spirochaetes bacterium GWF1_41_5]|nr:MAG: hypothetical protein A2096_16820 [Spirochaetes bacterium GWF1_41_5]HBE02438.1 hypothetical protein [Spirochaetia bacterium]
MNILVRKIYLVLIGLAGALLAWIPMESVIILQPRFSSYLLFTLTSGILFGMVMGAVFAMADGVILSMPQKIKSGFFTGLLSGAAGGAAGLLAAQALLFPLGAFFSGMASFKNFGLPLTHALGWGITGIFIAGSGGIQGRSLNKLRIGLIGGLLGGFSGGLLCEYAQIIFPAGPARLSGFMLFGACLGFFYSLAEKAFSFGVLVALSGKNRGREYLLTRGHTVISTSPGADIPGGSGKYTEIKVVRGEPVIKTMAAGNLTVNEENVQEQKLRMGDVVKVGEDKFMYTWK